MKSTMQRFFDFQESLHHYYQRLEQRFTVPCEISLTPAQIPSAYKTSGTADLSSIGAVLWDVYGTLCGMDLGDLEKTLEHDEHLLRAARATIAEFSLEEPLMRMEPDQSSENTLRDLYLQMIDDSHLRSLAEGTKYPEVLIEQIWLQILRECTDHGLRLPQNEPPLHTAYRCACFFDWSLQHIYLYPHTGDALETLKKAGIIQGIISNAQFYTPLHLRRLLRKDRGHDDLELEDYFSEPAVLFSYEMGFSKPNLEAFRRALAFLNRQGIAPEQVLFIGNDMLKDIWAAAQCGMKTMLFAGDNRQTVLREDEPLCRNLRPDAVVTDMKQIAELILGH
jgi:putative hydrolase of the HAD superfamily